MAVIAPERKKLRGRDGLGLEPRRGTIGRVQEPRASEQRPLWQIVGFLYAGLILVIAFVITLSFVVAHLVTGRAY